MGLAGAAVAKAGAVHTLCAVLATPTLDETKRKLGMLMADGAAPANAM